MSDAGSSHLRSLILGPVVCTAVLVAMSFENRRYISQADLEPFHARAARAIDSVPLAIPPWMGSEIPMRKEERDLLKPNAYRCIEYVDTRAEAITDPSRNVKLMVVECRRANHMVGHYPPNCYPAQGYMEAGERPRDWTIAGQAIEGMEYQYERREQGRIIRTCVYNFMVLPQQGIKRDMKAVYASAEDYQQRYYGAAQFQVLFYGPLADASARDERDGIFAELIAPCVGVIQTLSEGAIEP
jgi:hypothetical protein